MPTGNNSNHPADWGVSQPPPPAAASTFIATGAVVELAGATCLLMESLQGERANSLVYVCYFAVLVGAAMVFYGLRLGRSNGMCAIKVGERYTLPAHTIDPCPHTWGAGSVVTFYEHNDAKNGVALTSSDPITDVSCTVMLDHDPNWKSGLPGGGTGPYRVTIIQAP